MSGAFFFISLSLIISDAGQSQAIWNLSWQEFWFLAFALSAIGVVSQLGITNNRLRQNRPSVRFEGVADNKKAEIFQRQIMGNFMGHFVNDPPFETHVTGVTIDLTYRTLYGREEVIKRFPLSEITVKLVRSRGIDGNPNDWVVQDDPLHIPIGGTDRSDLALITLDSDLTFRQLVEGDKHQAVLRLRCSGQRQDVRVTRFPVDWEGANP